MKLELDAPKSESNKQKDGIDFIEAKRFGTAGTYQRSRKKPSSMKAAVL